MIKLIPIAGTVCEYKKISPKTKTQKIIIAVRNIVRVYKDAMGFGNV